MQGAALQSGDEAVGHAVVIDAPLYFVASAEGEREQGVGVVHLARLERVDGCDGLADLCHLVALEGRPLSESAVAECHADVVLLEQQFAVALYVVVDAVAGGNSHFGLSVGTGCADFLLRVGGKARKE